MTNTEVPDVLGVTDWPARARDLAAQLTADGAITDPAWWAAFEATPRHVFVPAFWALDGFNAPDHLVSGDAPEQRAEWLDAVYSNQFLTTQVSEPEEDGRRQITSSASLPALVARMLHLLDLRDGLRVLEIGTGSGYNTALLSHRVGADAVTSIDIDPVLVGQANKRLARISHHPTLITGDGAEGVDQNAPYNRILSTCASAGVPAAWIRQLAMGGVIVAPFTVGGALAVLTKTDPDEVSGHLDQESAWFMPMRPAGQPLPDGFLVDLPDPAPALTSGTADIDPAVFNDPDWLLWLHLHLPPGSRLVNIVDDDFTRTGVIVHTATHRAEAHFPTNGTTVTTVQQDEQRLFDTVDVAWRAWQHHGHPERHRIGITARADGTALAWLDSPGSGIAWPLPTS